MKYRIEVQELSPQVGGVPGGRHAIFEQEYNSSEEDGLLYHIRLQLDEWDEEEAQQEEARNNKERLAVVLGVMNQNPAGIMLGPDDIEYEEEGDKATFNINVDGLEATVSVTLQ